jgi:hypothetical protein
MTRKIDTSTKGSRPTQAEAEQALKIYADLKRPTKPPVKGAR